MKFLLLYNGPPTPPDHPFLALGGEYTIEVFEVPKV